MEIRWEYLFAAVVMVVGVVVCGKRGLGWSDGVMVLNLVTRAKGK